MQTAVDFFKNLPWYILYPGKAVAAVAGGYVSQNPQIFPSWAVLLGAAVALWVVLAFLWHALNSWRENTGKAKLQLDPQVILILFLVATLGAAIWRWQRATSVDPKIAILTAQVEGLQKKIALQQTTTPAAATAPAPAPIKPSKNYFPAEKKDLGDLYTFILARLNKDGMLAAKMAYDFGGDTPADHKAQLLAHLDRVSESRKLVSDVAKYIYNDAIANNPSYNSELTQLFSNSPDNVPIGRFRRELEKYHRAISLFVDRYDGLANEDRVITADLIKQTTPRLLETSQLFQNWIQQCNERIDAQRELLR